ncbi:sigma-70 family RNA polymerase sigma factor [Gorillibacterium sp. CAU 1737]|uniref:RNA polymerase sigma factor n=1 Tax=Gorillibacterium sp. CAU 1737 TaxID=3140362 RepID=UPI003261153F
MDDAERFDRIRAGDEDALNELIEHHYDSIRRYCYWKTRQSALAEDLTQETFYRFCRSLSRYTHKGKCRAYLYTIARRLCIDALRDKQPEPIDQVAEAEIGAALSAEEEASAHFQSEELLRLLQGLPPEQQEAVILRYTYGLRYREIAEVTDVPLYKARIRVERGLAALKKMWREEDFDEKEPARAPKGTSAAPCSRS